MCRKLTSVPQMPQARIRTRASLGPGTGRSMSTTSTLFWLPVWTDFIVAMGRFSSGLEESSDFTVFPFESGMGVSLSGC